MKGACAVSATKYQLNKSRKSHQCTFMLAQEKDRYYTPEYAWNTARLTLIDIVRTLSIVRPVLVVALKCLSFLFICPIYRHRRNTYLSDVLQTHCTHELLYGKEAATDLENEALFLNVQDYIIHSKRFD